MTRRADRLSRPASSGAGQPAAVFCPARLRGWRHARGLPLPEVAARAHVPALAVVAFENGTTTPDTATLERVAAALGCGPDTLCSAPDADPVAEYWDAACTALPPLTPEEIDSVATTLRRIHTRHDAAG